MNTKLKYYEDDTFLERIQWKVFAGTLIGFAILCAVCYLYYH
ncbi:hypothetical protein [Chryseobacterium taklimakanense]|nr:hypothetical protein [Chryseobacterium taklimakanense]